ncbi:MAG: signal peptidase I [Candidatus Magnetominusculus sp. LBB02]|nr:signal peptidase I [Candidatus Magnetominusculus sp. LBB02]
MKKTVYREYSEAIVTALLLALFIRAFVIQAYKIPSGSMETTLLVGDQLLVNKFIYGVMIPFTEIKIFTFNQPKKGDIIVFKYPEDLNRDFIKRVIAVGGDVVEVVDKEVYVNHEKLVEPFIQHTDTSMRNGIPPRDNMEPRRVPPGKFFVMGDNRDNSQDSRFWGFVDQNLIRGKALIIYWSWDNAKELRWYEHIRFNRIGRLIK